MHHSAPPVTVRDTLAAWQANFARIPLVSQVTILGIFSSVSSLQRSRSPILVRQPEYQSALAAAAAAEDSGSIESERTV